MKVNYIKTPDGVFLMSYHVHDYKEHTTKDGMFFMVDGGANYFKYSTPSEDFVFESSIEKLIETIREDFKWTRTLNEEGVLLLHPETILLKDLTTDHIINILIYILPTVNKIAKPLTSMILLEELKYRYKHKLI